MLRDERDDVGDGDVSVSSDDGEHGNDVSMQGGESPASGPQQCSCYVRTIKLEN